MPSHYERTKIPKKMEHLFKHDLSGKERDNRYYKYIGPDGEPKEAWLGDCDELRPIKCLIDGCFVIQRSGDPHNYLECPCCGQYFSEEGRTPAEYQKNLAETVKRREEELKTLKGLLAMAENPNHPARTANRNNSLYS
jgi:hypothetical protein